MEFFNPFESLAHFYSSLAEIDCKLERYEFVKETRKEAEYYSSLAQKYGGLRGFLRRNLTHEDIKYSQQAEALREDIHKTLVETSREAVEKFKRQYPDLASRL